MGRPFNALVMEARHALHLENRSWAEFVGTSLRSVERYGITTGLGNPAILEKLLVRLYAVNPGLAKELADAGNQSLEALGLVKPAPPPPPPVPAAVAAPVAKPIPEARSEHADAVLVAAANVNDVSPETVRPILIAAFARASELGVSVEGLAKHLARGAPAATVQRSASPIDPVAQPPAQR